MPCFGKSSTTTDDDALVHRLHDLTLERDALKKEGAASAKEVARLSALVEGQTKKPTATTKGAKVKSPKKEKKDAAKGVEEEDVFLTETGMVGAVSAFVLKKFKPTSAADRTMSVLKMAALFANATVLLATAAETMANPREEEDGAGGVVGQPSRAEMQLTIEKLGAVSTVLGQQTTTVFAIQCSLDAAKEAKEEAEGDESNSGSPKWYIQDGQIAPKERELAAALAVRDKTQLQLSTMRSEAGTSVMVLAKAGEAQYDAAWAEQLTSTGGAAAATSIVSIADTLVAAAPKPAAAGQKAAMQPAGSTIPFMQRTGLVVIQQLFALLLTAVETKLINSTGSKCCLVFKAAARAFEKVLLRWAGDPRCVTDYGRSTLVAQNLPDLLQMLELVLIVCETNGYTITSCKNSLDAGKEVIGVGYRNLMLTIRDAATQHIVELQLNLASIEAVKGSPCGHIV